MAVRGARAGGLLTLVMICTVAVLGDSAAAYDSSPTATARYVAWAHSLDFMEPSDVYVSDRRRNRPPLIIRGELDRSREGCSDEQRPYARPGGIHRNRLLYTVSQFNDRECGPDQTQFYLYNLRSQKRRVLDIDVGERGFAAAHGLWRRWVLSSRVVNPTGAERRTQLLLNNYATAETILVAEAGRLYPGGLAGRYLTYTTCDPDCTVTRLDWRSGESAEVPEPAAGVGSAVLPDGTVYFLSGPVIGAFPVVRAFTGTDVFAVDGELECPSDVTRLHATRLRRGTVELLYSAPTFAENECDPQYREIHRLMDRPRSRPGAMRG